jgi:Ser-tRNA(Ala) deacylase AlaX
MGEKVYERDPYCRELATSVSTRECRDGRWRVRLERTIFRPEGGGQPEDAGTVNNLPLMALDSENDDIVHVLGGDPGGGEAVLRLDFERRFDHMQQHTAQHLLSQVLLRRFTAATLSFAIGPEHSSIETDRPGFSDGEVAELEEECARLAWAALPVRAFETDDVSGLGLRKPPKVQGRVRVVEIAGFDRSACGGTHVRSSAELGLLKIVRLERVRANARLYYVAGGRALRDHQRKHDLAQRLQRLVTQPLPEIPAHVEALLRERDDLRNELKKNRRREMEREAGIAATAADALVVREFSGCEPADLRCFAGALAAVGKHALAFSRPQAAGTGIHVVVGRGGGDFDLRLISARFFALLAGRGGGGASLLEGRAKDLSRLDEAIALLRASLGPRV